MRGGKAILFGVGFAIVYVGSIFYRTWQQPTVPDHRKPAPPSTNCLLTVPPGQMRIVLHQTYQLPIDHRFSMAADELERLYGSKTTGALATAGDLPGFIEVFTILKDRAAKLNSQKPLAPQSGGQVAEPAALFATYQTANI